MSHAKRINECAERRCLAISRDRFVVGCMASKTLHDCCEVCVVRVLRDHTTGDCAGVVVTTPGMNFRWEGS